MRAESKRTCTSCRPLVGRQGENVGKGVLARFGRALTLLRSRRGSVASTGPWRFELRLALDALIHTCIVAAVFAKEVDPALRSEIM